MITKGQIVNGTYALMRISGLTKSASPEDVTVALQVADDYAAELSTQLELGWQQPSLYGESDPDDTSGLSLEMAGPFKKLLVRQLAAYFGKPVPPEVEVTARESMKFLEDLLVTIPDAQLPPTLPFGSGNEWDYRDRKFYDEPANNKNADYVFKDTIRNFTFDFSHWLVDETLTSVTWESFDSPGLVIGTETFDDTTATAELTFNQVGGYTVCAVATKTGSTDNEIMQKRFIVQDCDDTGLRFIR